MIEQNNIFSWYRAADKKNPFGIWKPVSLENTTFRITLRNTENGKIFCPLHCIWEDYERHNEFEIECSGKKTFNGLIIPWIPQKKKPEPKNRGVLVINKILQNQQEYNYNYNSRLYNSCDSDDTDFEKDIYDNDNINYNCFLYTYSIDYKNFSCTIKERTLNRKKILSIPEGNFSLTKLPETENIASFYFKGKKCCSRNPSQNSETYTIYNSLGKKAYDEEFPKIPDIVSKQIEATLPEFINNYAGRKIFINTGFYHGIALLNALSFFPYEANIFPVAKQTGLLKISNNSTILTSETNHDDTQIYNQICSLMEIKSFTSLHKLFNKIPNALIWYKNITNIGFRDINIIMDILNTCAATAFSKEYTQYSDLIHYYSINYWDKDLENIKEKSANLATTFIDNINEYNALTDNVFTFFCSYSIPLRGERATWNAINKEPRMYYKDRADIARNFQRYFSMLKPEERYMIVHEGFTTRVHDTLSKIIENLQYTNQTFTYSNEQKKLEDEIDGFSFKLPPDSEFLHNLGSEMHNCVFSYWEYVYLGECTIVYAIKDGKFEACIEVANSLVISQARSSYNKQLTGDIQTAFIKWCKKHKLKY